jgi:hypothetical protein
LQGEAHRSDEEPRRQPPDDESEQATRASSVVNIVQQNAIIVTGRRVRRGQAEPKEQGTEGAEDSSSENASTESGS